DSSEGKTAGWRSAPVDGENRGSIYGRTLIFEPGTRSENPESLPAAPLGTDIPSWDAYVSEHDQSFFLELKKLVLTPQYDHSLDRVFDDSRSLRLEESNGATLLGEFITVPVS
ncbi:MAG: hypothetical protein NT069_26085, partial [Planctomycetota bacterium]|nr:hypothetical protein [Planctomycetota bacterium]